MFFTQGTVVIKATVDFFGSPVLSTQTCKIAKPGPFVAVAAQGTTPPTTTPPVTVGAVTTTTAATAAPAGGSTLPRTGASVVLWLVVAALFIDAGIVAILSTKRKARYLFHRNG